MVSPQSTFHSSNFDFVVPAFEAPTLRAFPLLVTLRKQTLGPATVFLNPISFFRSVRAVRRMIYGTRPISTSCLNSSIVPYLESSSDLSPKSRSSIVSSNVKRAPPTFTRGSSSLFFPSSTQVSFSSSPSIPRLSTNLSRVSSSSGRIVERVASYLTGTELLHRLRFTIPQSVDFPLLVLVSTSAPNQTSL